MNKFGEWMQGRWLPFQFLIWTLRGTAQVNFVNNPLSGVIIIIGLIVQQTFLALVGYLGVVSSTFAALILQLNRTNIKAGLYGYNGLLVGILMAVLCSGGKCTWWLLIPIVIVAMASTLVASALGKFLGTWELPALTLPFNVAVTIFIAATGHYNAHFPAVLIRPPSNSYNVSWDDLNVLMLLRAVPIGVGQVYACDNVWAGIVIAVAIFISSPINFLHAVIGSASGILAGLSLGSPLKKIHKGIWGYNAVIGCAAIGGVFYALTWQTHLLSIACAFFCAYLGEAMMNMMAHFGLPALTWPFCIATLPFLLITSNCSAIFKIPLSRVTYPEENRRYYKYIQESKFKENTEEDNSSL
uniref:LOW QUALITY PROTEIN: urea transporter 2-like n=1 Tax=Myxine glutinosa TaxID=7769 RepID=UPI00358E19FD